RFGIIAFRCHPAPGAEFPVKLNLSFASGTHSHAHHSHRDFGMAQARIVHYLDRPVDVNRDHILGPPDAAITLVEYGSYACPFCRAANERIAELREQFGERMRYVFRHKPLAGSDLARRAAELVEHARDPEQFWR